MRPATGSRWTHASKATSSADAGYVEHGIHYAFRRDREPEDERTSEEFFVGAPADTDEKVRGTRFEQAWLDAHPDSTAPEGCVLQPSLFAEGFIPT